MHTQRGFAGAVLGLAALTLLLASPERAGAVMITWSAARNITGDTDVDTTGTFLEGLNLGATGVTDTTVNGQSFTALAESFGSNGLGSASSPFSGLSSAYQDLLSTGITADSFSGPGLKLGDLYEVEFWCNNSSTANSETTTFSDRMGDSVTLSNNTTDTVGGLGQFVIGTFIADGNSIFISGTGDGWVNAFQERHLGPATAAPEPASLTLLGLGAAGLVGFGCRKKRSA
jgi:hypothetical protein